MSFPAQIGAHIGAALLVVGAVWLVWVVLRMLLKTRPGAHPGGGKSAGSSARPRPWRRDAKAEGLAGPEAADTVPDGGGLLPRPPSGIAPGDWAYGYNVPTGSALPDHDMPVWGGCAAEAIWHPYRCTMPSGHGGKHRAGDGCSVVAEWTDPIDEHIDTAAALLSPGSPVERDGEFADAVENWLRLVTPPVVPGGES